MSLSILLVDDAGFIRSMLREILETEGGHRVVAEASDGTAALTLQPELKPDLVISDIIMPGMDGIEMTRALVASDPSVRVMVSAAHDQEGAVLRALTAGAVDFLRKPFSALEVLGTLAEPPLPPEPADGEESLLLVRITLKPFTPLPAARLRVLSSRCARMGRIVRLSPDPSRAPAACAAGVLEIKIRTRHDPEVLRHCLQTLRGIAEVTADVVERKPDMEISETVSRPVRSLPGAVRIRATLLDRLLDRVEEAEVSRDQLAAAVGTSDIAAEAEPALKKLERNLAEIRAEVRSARMVPFDRVLQRLTRCVEESGRAVGREATLFLTGGGSRVDLAVLEEMARILSRLLPRLVEKGIPPTQRADRPDGAEAGRVEMAASRHGSALALILRVPAPQDAEPGELLDAETRERISRLGGCAGVIRDERGWRVEMVIPAGVAVVRSYLCQAGKHLFAVPVGSIEKAVDLDAARIRVREGQSFWEEDPDDPIPLVRFERVPWVDADGASRAGFPGLLYRVGPQRYALALDAVLGETDVVVRPAPESEESGRLTGTAILPDGGVALVPDLLRLARIR